MTKLTNVEQINSEAKQVSGISSSTSKTNNKIKNLSEVQQQMRQLIKDKEISDENISK